MQQTHEVMRKMHCFTYESARVGEEDGAFPGDFLGDLGLGVSRETFEAKRPLSGWIDRHNSRHSLNPTVMSPSPASSRISLCSGVIGL